MSIQSVATQMTMNTLTLRRIASLELYQWLFVTLIGSAQVV